MGLIPAFTLASSSLTLAGSIQNSLVATHLAQEGVEVVRAIRDADWFAGNSFGKSLDSCTSPDATIKCRVQYDSTSTTQLPILDNPALKKDPDTGLFQYTKGADTLYHREVTITAISAHERKVIVTITWNERSGTKTFELEDHLYDWLQ